MTPTELLAELHRRGIAVHRSDDDHLRLTAPAEAALTPALRAEVEAQREALVTLLAPPLSGSGDGTTAAAPDAQETGASALPGWLWGALALVVAVAGATYWFTRPAAPAPQVPSPAPLPAGWPYGGQSW